MPAPLTEGDTFSSSSKKSQNHRMVGVGRALCGSPSPTPCPSRVTQSRLHSTASRQVLSISREGDSTASLGSLCQGSTKKIKQELPKQGKQLLQYHHSCTKLKNTPALRHLSLMKTKMLLKQSIFQHSKRETPKVFAVAFLKNKYPPSLQECSTINKGRREPWQRDPTITL